MQSQQHKVYKYLFLLLNLFLVTNIMFATTGIALFKHYCFVDEKQEVSMFSYTDDCDHSAIVKTCCTIKELHVSDNADIAADCCAVDFDYLAITTPVTLKDQFTLNELIPLPILLSFAKRNLIENINASHYNSFHPSKIPLPASGKDIIIEKQAFLA